MRKNELLKKLEAKEQECLELRSKLEKIVLPQMDMGQTESYEMPQVSIDVAYAQKIAEKQQTFDKAMNQVLSLVNNAVNQSETNDMKDQVSLEIY